jgi:hypothetical protein
MRGPVAIVIITACEINDQYHVHILLYKVWRKQYQVRNVFPRNIHEMKQVMWYIATFIHFHTAMVLFLGRL